MLHNLIWYGLTLAGLITYLYTTYTSTDKLTSVIVVLLDFECVLWTLVAVAPFESLR